MYFHFKHNATGWIYWNYTGITLKSHWMGYTETTLELHWNAPGWIHWNSTAPPAPQMHLQCTPNAPPAHPKCTSTSFTYLHPHLQRTSQHHNLYKSMFSHKIRSAPLSTLEVHPTPGALRTSAHRGISGSTMAPGGTNPLPQSMLTNHQRGLVAFTWWQFHRKC